jgi:tripartite ATP-independent transporter DctP family solute receptor
MRKIAAVLLGALVGFAALALALGTAEAQEKKITAKIADILSPDHPHSTTMQFFADKVKERTKGRVEFQVFNSAQLGQTKDLFMGVQTGSIEIAKMPASFAGEWIPEEKVWDLPYLFNSRDELWRVIRSNVGKKFTNEFFPKQGLVGVFWVDDGGRSIYANKPVRKPEDLKGMKIRVQPSDIQIQAINEMGGIGTPLAFGEVYLALQQKVLDGAENSPVLYWTSKHWEVNKVYSLTEQFWSVSTFIANKKWWDGLPKDIQGEITAAGQDAEAYFLKEYVSLESKAIGLLKEKGVTVVTDVDKATFEKRIQPVYDTFVKKYPFGKDLLEQVRAAKK